MIASPRPNVVPEGVLQPSSAHAVTPNKAENRLITKTVDRATDKVDPLRQDLESKRAEEATKAGEEKLKAELTRSIADLVSTHGELDSRSKQTRQQLKTLRSELGQRLHAYKEKYVSPGRNGAWAGFLREINLPLSTADRYVAIFERSRNPPISSPEEIQKENMDPVARLVQSLEPRLKRVLASAEAVSAFVDQVRALFDDHGSAKS